MYKLKYNFYVLFSYTRDCSYENIIQFLKNAGIEIYDLYTKNIVNFTVSER